MQKFVTRMLVVAGLVGCFGQVVVAEAAQASTARRQEYQWSPLHWAVRYNDADAARELASGRNLEARDSLGRTPLHIAAMFGRDEMVSLLLARGAEVNARDKWGVTPLYRLELMRRFRGWDHSAIATELRAKGGVKMDMRGERE